MQINKVRLCNFSSYFGETEIDFSTQAGKNIVLVGGNNGAGKTSLFTAIKLALYGPQCFHFQEKNNQYTLKIKNLINHDAYLMVPVHAYVELDISIPMDRISRTYHIKREWIYQNKRLSEQYIVSQDGITLNTKDTDFFQNYLFSVIPPNLFDFFFFDGEDVGDFFTSGHYNQYLKNAILTLCGYDTFSIIKKYCASFVNSYEDNNEYNTTRALIEQTETQRVYLETKLTHLLSRIEELNEKIADFSSQKSALEDKFLRSGGLTQERQDELSSEMKRQEHIKEDKNRRIRDFVESSMPLVIVSDLASRASIQLSKERELQQYQTIMSKLSVEVIDQIIRTKRLPFDNSFANQFLDGLSGVLQPEWDTDGFAKIHDLSEEAQNHVTSMMVKLSDFDRRGMIKTVREKEKAARKYDEAAKTLRSALPDIDANAYLAEITKLTNDIEQYQESVQTSQKRLEEAQNKLQDTQKLLERLYKALQTQAKDQTAFKYTARIQKVMDAMIQQATRSKFEQVQKLAIQMFQQIIRKENYVDLIELDDDFTINLYKTQNYTVSELALLLRNIGMDELEYRLGNTGVVQAMKILSCNTKKEFRDYLAKAVDTEQIGFEDDQTLKLYKRLEINQLSKGEKQVFVLALYWAIIKSSGQRIPFIIDTPFARIDTEHREQISRVFFPGISNQVVIFSTDEEVVGPYYEVISNSLAHQYTLNYIESTGRTVVSDGYFVRSKHDIQA